MTHQPTQKDMQPYLPYVDRPDIGETFVDSLETVIFDGSSVRMEFVVHRFDPPQMSGEPSGARVTAARVVLPLNGATNLVSQLGALLAALEQQGHGNGVMLMQSRHAVR